MDKSWKSITITTTKDAEDIVSGILYELDFNGVEIKDNVPLTEAEQKAMFIDFLPEVDENDSTANIICYVDMDADLDEKIREINEKIAEYRTFTDVPEVTISTSETHEEDWINNWKKFFKSFRIDDSIVIKPTWEETADIHEGDLVVEIDPGTAFGTGAHETTKLCILNLKKYLKSGDNLLDVGTGSGILSIIGKMLGADTVNAIDIDPIAVAVSKENTILNRLPVKECENPSENKSEIAYFEGDIIGDRNFRYSFGLHKYEVVVANILADVIIPLSGVIYDNMKEGGIFISSGIINTREEEVRNALTENGFTVLEVSHMKDWVSFVATK